jgi:hypothetical protein
LIKIPLKAKDSKSMRKKNILILIFIISFTCGAPDSTIKGFPVQLPVKSTNQDTLRENQILYNGRIWRNLFFHIQGDQYLFSKEFLSGSVSISGKSYPNILIKYDVYSDEILTPIDSGRILQLNKELVDSFYLVFQNKTYHFRKIREDSLKRFQSFVNVLYEGKTSLYIKYSKRIDRSAIEGKPDSFYQMNRIIFVKDNLLYTITDKSDLFGVLKNDKVLIRDFMKKNKLKVSKKEPESFVPVLIYYDSISR